MKYITKKPNKMEKPIYGKFTIQQTFFTNKEGKTLSLEEYEKLQNEIHNKKLLCRHRNRRTTLKKAN